MPSVKTNLEALRGGAATLTPTEHDLTPEEPSTRFTVDLPDSDHMALKMLALESRMTMSDVIRAAVKLMREQDDLATAVKRRARSL